MGLPVVVGKEEEEKGWCCCVSVVGMEDIGIMRRMGHFPADLPVLTAVSL